MEKIAEIQLSNGNKYIAVSLDKEKTKGVIAYVTKEGAVISFGPELPMSEILFALTSLENQQANIRQAVKPKEETEKRPEYAGLRLPQVHFNREILGESKPKKIPSPTPQQWKNKSIVLDGLLEAVEKTQNMKDQMFCFIDQLDAHERLLKGLLTKLVEKEG